MRSGTADRALIARAEHAIAVAMKATYEAGWAACDGVFKDQLDFQEATRRDAIKKFADEVRIGVVAGVTFDIHAKNILHKQMKVRIRRALKGFKRTFLFCVPAAFFFGCAAGYALSLVV